jgi:RsiW-degrading membrane proteinase PrsW (M82 family)
MNRIFLTVAIAIGFAAMASANWVYMLPQAERTTI